MFVDSSVIVAILSDEADAVGLADRIEADACITSPLVVLESCMRLSTKLDIDPLVVAQRLDSFFAEARIRIVGLDPGTERLAVTAFAKYGKGRGHPAQLNLSDCMSYACAKQHNVALLYKGNDFAQTDLA